MSEVEVTAEWIDSLRAIAGEHAIGQEITETEALLLEAFGPIQMARIIQHQASTTAAKDAEIAELREVLHDTVRTNTENCRQRDAALCALQVVRDHKPAWLALNSKQAEQVHNALTGKREGV